MLRPAPLIDVKVVALGGGHGLSASLSALRHVVTDLTAVVTVADNGGSSGRLRPAVTKRFRRRELALKNFAVHYQRRQNQAKPFHRQTKWRVESESQVMTNRRK